ncbi:hypothetical protein [Natrononativus amylolyticus]|uniref:hypothetical protein n=1 Tax=Natrononativus amylolyticus TaxID=2963434 RepID=UPI0020CCD4EB|nr:hypothetical protein [Natrononativus amylolyticus]
MIAAYVAFAGAMLPPVLWLVNEPILIAGYPLLYLWAIAWGTIGIAVLYVTVRLNLFGIGPDQVPPELRQQETPVPTDSTVHEIDATEGDD